MNWEDRCCLIQSDPVTCVWHFDYQVNQFPTKFLLSSAEPLGKISVWFYRVEYQQRESPHIHMLISCHKPVHYPKLFDLVNTIQVHRHSHTYRKEYNKSM